MSARNLESLPDHCADETSEQYTERLQKIYYDHLDECPDCNYDHECNACAADLSAEENVPQLHNCNCSEHGWGTRLRSAFQKATS